MTDNINPEYQHPPKDENVTPAPQPAPEKKGGNGVALLALLVGAFGAGVGFYNFQQAQKHHLDYADGQENPVIAQLEVAVQQQGEAQQNFAKASEVADLAKTVAALREEANAKGAGIDKAELEKMISNAIAASQLTPEQIAQMAGGVNKEEVQTLINQSLTQLAEGEQKIDFSKEITEIQAIATEAKTAAEQAQSSITKLEEDKTAILQMIDEKVKSLDANLAEKTQTFSNSLDQKIATLQQTVGEIDTNAINPAPLLNALKLAQMAASNGNYVGAKSYLDQAVETFTLFGLSHSAYAGFQKDIANLRAEYTNLATNPTPAAQVNSLIAGVSGWTLKDVAAPQAEAAPAQEETEQETTWVDTIKGVGQNILNNTVRVTPLDEAGLVWINANEALQNVIRENVRLDLAFARNALQLGDYASYAAMAEQAQANINRYFDTSNGQVAATLDLLAKLKNQSKHGDDIGNLIQTIEQTK